MSLTKNVDPKPREKQIEMYVPKCNTNLICNSNNIINSNISNQLSMVINNSINKFNNLNIPSNPKQLNYRPSNIPNKSCTRPMFNPQCLKPRPKPQWPRHIPRPNPNSPPCPKFPNTSPRVYPSSSSLPPLPNPLPRPS